MAKSKVERTVSRMVSKIQSFRKPMSKPAKFGYWTLMVLLIISVAFLPAFLRELIGTTLPAFIPIIVFSAAVLAILIVRKNKAEKDFWQTKDIADKVNYIEVTDASELEKFCDDNTWVFGSKKEELMPFIYNWLLTSDAIGKNDKINVYYLSVNVIKSRFKHRDDAKQKLAENQELFLIKLAELDFDDETKFKINSEASVLRPFDFYVWLTKNFVVSGLNIEPADESDEDEDEYDEEYEDDSDEYEDDESDDSDDSDDSGEDSEDDDSEGDESDDESDEDESGDTEED